MVDAITSALSGLNAQKLNLQNRANNIANARSDGALPSAKQVSTTKQAYRPQDTILTSTDPGVSAISADREPSFVTTYRPDASFADERGFVARSNVDLGEEVIGAQQASRIFEANASVIETQNEMDDELLDILT